MNHIFNENDMVLTDLGFGDSGKGSFVQYIASVNPQIKKFIKYNGGCQGRHCIIHNGKHIVFSQLSSAMVYDHACTILGKKFVFEPFSLLNEIKSVSDALKISPEDIISRLYIDKSCVCVTPIHKIYNQWEEEFVGVRGSVGTGVSIAGMYSSGAYEDITLYASDLLHPFLILSKLCQQADFFQSLQASSIHFKELKERICNINVFQYCIDLVNIMETNSFMVIDTEKIISDDSCALYESSQGILLDKKYGFYPNTTLLDLSIDSISGIKNKTGIIRSVYTRHGKGVFPTKSAELQNILSDSSQEIGKYSGRIMFGYFDCVLLRYAVKTTGIHQIYMSHLDYLKLDIPLKICISYRYAGKITEEFKSLFDYELNKSAVYIRNIKKPHKNLSLYLKSVIPVYKEIEFTDICSFYHKTDIYTKAIEQECGIPVSVISFGADIQDKYIRNQSI